MWEFVVDFMVYFILLALAATFFVAALFNIFGADTRLLLCWSVGSTFSAVVCSIANICRGW